jgi:hypothetical protein
MRQNSTSSGNDSKPGLGQAGGNVRGEAQGSASVEGSGSEQAIRPESGGIGPATPNLSPGSGASSVTSALPGSPAPATSYEELQQQGYAVWQPGYLPAGYSLASYSTQPSGLAAGDITAKNGLLITYRNNQTGGWITLEIQPQHSSLPVAAPAAPYAATEAAAPPAAQPAPAGSASANTTANQPPGITASVNPTVVQQPGAGQITRSAIENGSVFTLTVSGSLSGQELQKVADSVQ